VHGSHLNQLFLHGDDFMKRMVKILLDQIANTHGIKALTSIKLLLEACQNGVFSNVRREIVSYDGIDVILKYIRKDFTRKDSWKQKEENQDVGFQILLQLTRDPENVVKMVEIFFKTTVFAKNVLLSFISDDQKKKLHLAEMQNNINAYWMILDLIRPTFLNFRQFRNITLKLSLTESRGISNLPKRYSIFSAYYFACLIMIKKKGIQQSY